MARAAPSDLVGPSSTNQDVDSDDPNLTAPLPRYNAMLAVLRNTLYMYENRGCISPPSLTPKSHRYGGIFEKGSREYSLDDFYSIQLDKLDRYTCLKHSGIVIAEEDENSSDEDDGDSEDDDEEEEEDEADDATLVAVSPAMKAKDLLDMEEIEVELEAVAEEPELAELATVAEGPGEDAVSLCGTIPFPHGVIVSIIGNASG